MFVNSLLTSGIEFDEGEDYLEFKFRLLNAVMLIGIVCTTLFVAFDLSAINALGPWQLLVTGIDGITTLGLLVLLRGRKNWYVVVAWVLLSINFLTFISALVLVVNDELRVIWFYVNLVTVYILLGQGAGLLMTVTSMAVILGVNHFMAVPFSARATTTLLISFGVTSVIAFAFIDRARSCYERMSTTIIRLNELADKDPLTGLLNPRAYYETANRMIRLAQRTSAPFAVLFVDLDHFKAINDNFGHDTGDAVLRHVAHCLANHLRQSDVLGRIGGEEFAFFLPNTTLEGATRLGEKLRGAVANLEPTETDAISLGITASIGIADYHSADQSVADIQRRADRAMYQAKMLGRNRIVAIAAN